MALAEIKGRGEDLSPRVWAFVNVVASSFAILLTKWSAAAIADGPMAIFAAMHLVTTWVVLDGAWFLRRVHAAPLAFDKRLWLAAVLMISIVSANISLKANSIGLYELGRLLAGPYSWFWRGEGRMGLEMACIGAIGAGLVLFAGCDPEFHWAGLVVVSAVGLGHAQMEVVKAVRDYDVSGVSLQQSIIDLEFGLTVVVATVMDCFGNSSIWRAVLRPIDMVVLVVGCVCAAGVNASMFSLWGGLGPRNWQVVVDVKAVVVLVGGYLFFPSKWTGVWQLAGGLCGLVIALAGGFGFASAARMPLVEEREPFIGVL